MAHVTVDPNILELIAEYTTKIHPTDKIPIFFEIDQIAEYANKHAGSYHDLTWFIWRKEENLYNEMQELRKRYK